MATARRVDPSGKKYARLSPTFKAAEWNPRAESVREWSHPMDSSGPGACLEGTDPDPNEPRSQTLDLT